MLFKKIPIKATYHDFLESVTALLASLELAKRKRVSLYQKIPFGKIQIRELIIK